MTVDLGLELYLGVAAFLYALGIYCLATKRNLIKVTIGIEILLSAGNLNLMAFSAFRVLSFVDPLPQALAILSIVIGGLVAAIALSIVINVYRHYGTLDTRKIKKLKW
ncbi:MAG: NADH-quinone oxidoreductase subunit K [Candidatus Atabeyarchaeum deiterrae]|jgi:NADH:ubiquinone oxidoreductase subunit K